MKTTIVMILLVAMILSLFVSFFTVALAPTFTNDIALGQLENDDASFAIMQTWTLIQEVLYGIQVLIWIVAAIIICVQIYKYIKNKKENND